MAISVYGAGPTINATQWAKLMQGLGDAGAGMIVKSGLIPAVLTGTRLVEIAAGDAIAAGVLAESSINETITLASNGVSNPRIDIVCLEVNWAGESGTGTIVAVQGLPAATPTAPALTQTPGTKWQIPLARVLVRPGVGQIATADLTDVRPVRARSGAAMSAATGWSLSNVACVRDGRVAQISGNITRTGAGITVPANGDVSNQNVAQLPEGFRPWAAAGVGSAGSGGRLAGYVLQPSGELQLVSVGGSGDIPNGAMLSFGGTYLVAD